MERRLGPVILGLLVLLAGLLRCHESARAGQILEGEAHALETLVALEDACVRLAGDGETHPDFARQALAAVPSLEPLADLGAESVAYAADEVYVYGVAAQAKRDERSGRLLSGWIVRAWPVAFGLTGDREYQLADDGLLWQSQNRAGRSGTTTGFPPGFPEPDVGLPRAPWRPVERPPHR